MARPLPLSLLLLPLLALGGCAAPPPAAESVPPAAEQDAASHAARGDYQGAAEIYLALAARAGPAESAGYRLEAAAALIEAGDLAAAQLQLSLIDPNKIKPTERLRLRLLLARMADRDGQPEKILELLGEPYPPETPADLRFDYHHLKSRAYAAREARVEAARELLAAAEQLPTGADRAALDQELWLALTVLKLPELTALHADATGATAGWLELAIIQLSMGLAGPSLDQALVNWQANYPDHPAAHSIVPQLKGLTKQLDRQPQRIGLLLPLHGALSESAMAIRDGFLAAWYASSIGQPPIRIYDANERNALSAYQQAVNDGAELIVGPLEKGAVAALLQLETLPVTTLALNQFDGDPGRLHAVNTPGTLPRLYQFGLAPEDEARQIAERAWFDGHALAIAMTPANEWGDRIFHAFAEQFEALGGKVLERASYDPGDPDFSTPVERLLNIDTSQQRARALRSFLKLNVESAPRLRQDADFMMLAAQPAAARQIGPQLLYHGATRLAVYATSHIFTGSIDRYADADLNGFMFADIPLLLDAGYANSPIFFAIKQHWPGRLTGYGRLFALGVDAFHLIPQLSRLTLAPGTSMRGATGDLTITQDGRIRRHLLWARFVDGIPQPLHGPALTAR
jgi:hypothetical protein